MPDQDLSVLFPDQCRLTLSYQMLIMYPCLSHSPHVAPETGHWQRKCDVSSPRDPGHMSLAGLLLVNNSPGRALIGPG